jgi:hypothetical protein
LAAAPGVAAANGDPASDVLLGDTVFLSYTPPSPSVEERLRKVIGESQAKGQPVRVAIIATPNDLGAVPDFFGKPGDYARYLAEELAAYNKLQHPNASGEPVRDPLIVVMPAGIGTSNVPKKVESELRKVEFAANADSDELASGAGWGVQELAKGNGKPIAATFAEPEKSSGGGGGVLVPLLVGLGLLLLAGAAIFARVKAGQKTPAAQSPGGNK